VACLFSVIVKLQEFVSMTKVIKSKALAVCFVKSIIVGLSFWFIYKRIFVDADFVEIWKLLLSNISSNYYILIIVIVFTGINWGLEAIKWLLIVNKIQAFTFFKAFKSVVSGIVIGLFTPNRVGEYGGRILYLEPSNRISGIVGAVTGNLSQLLITICFGIVSGVFFLDDYLDINYSYLLLIILPLLLWMFFKIDKLPSVFKSFTFKKYIESLEHFSRNELLKLLLYSFLRYFVFFLQFYLLLTVFDINISFFSALLSIPLIFLIISIIPTFALVEWGIRGSASLYFLSFYSDNSTGILAAATILWIFNIAIPALAGVGFILKARIS
jgi:MFS family permease